MIFDNYDVAILKLCGLCRNLPCDLKIRFDHPAFLKNIAGNLMAHKLIKTMPDRQSIKLTRIGKKVLADMGYQYPDDARPRSKGSIYQRRLISAYMNVLFHCVGIDIFADKIEQLNTHKRMYIPSLSIRANLKSKVLAGTCFLGILRCNDTAYVPYYIESHNNGIFPSYEEETFRSQIANLKEVKLIKLLFAGNSLEEVWSALFTADKNIKLPRGLTPYSKAFEVLGYSICLTSLNKSGVLQMSIMTQQNYRKRIVECFEFGQNQATELSNCDGIYENTTAIVAIDLDIKRLSLAIEETNLLNKDAYIICLNDQRELLQMYANMHLNVNIKKFLSIKRETIKQIFPDISTEPIAMVPFKTEKGDFVRVNELGEAVSKKTF